MKQQKFQILLASMLCMLVAGAPALAEDIEIYQSNNLGLSSVKPNLLFILDTSGSMGDTVTADELPNIPLDDVDYSLRIGACFDNNRIYKLPAGTTLDDVTCTSSFQQSYFRRTQNQCEEAETAFVRSGFFTDNFSQWKNNQNNWAVLTNSSQDSYYIECESDQGVHGNGGAATYIATSGSNPYTTNSTNSDTSWAAIESEITTLYTGNYMNYLVTAGSGVAVPKIDMMRNVVENVLYGVTGVNIGLMKFNYRNNVGNDGGVIKYPVTDVTASRNDMVSTMNTWNARGGTPLSESLYEAYRYYAGRPPYFAARSQSESTEGSATITETGTRYYDSPVDANAADCQRQFVVLLSDGWPHADADNSTDRGAIESVIGQSCDAPGVATNYYSGSWHYSISNSATNGKCLDDLAGWMNNTGFPAYLGGGNTIDNIRVTTYGIGFNTSVDVMRDMAVAGGGSYYEAYSSTQLTQTILNIIAEVTSIHTTFTSPAISVNAFNRTTHRSELYYTLFKPSTRPHWDGNLKRFKLDVALDGSVRIVDSNDNSAIDTVTGFFRPSAVSFWTAAADSPDGNETGKGGAASRLTNTRNVYSNVSASSSLSAASNQVAPGNSNITYAMLGIANDPTYRTNLLNWARGIDVRDEDADGDTADARRVMGDPLHAQPVLVQYGGTSSNPDITAYVATNDGYFHAFDTRTGEETFSFIPDDLLSKLNVAYSNSGSFKMYGLDGSVTAWVDDANQDGVISGTEHVYVYFGMRRGGRNYYALDVTDRSSPRVMWEIEGGTSSAQGDFTDLGDSWSTPVHRVLRLGNVERHVLIFGGGYDTNQDSVAVRTADTRGRAVFIVDAETGQLLWKADNSLTGFSNMDYSIPSDISAVDINGDGLIDKLYFGDMGGQIWRVDIDNDLGKTATSLYTTITGGRIADLADNTAASHRRFFYAPDVALLKNKSGSTYLSVLITSGSRTHPTNVGVQDRIFMLKDTPVRGHPSPYVTVTENNATHELFDTTDNIIGQGNTGQQDQAQQDLENSNGWYINLDASAGEKGLAKPLIFAGQAFLTTYVPANPAAQSANSCVPDEGTGYLYHIYLEDGTPVVNYDPTVSNDPDNLTREDRIVQLEKGGIPPEPKYMRPEKQAGGEDPGDCVVVGTKVFCLGPLPNKERLYWYEAE